MSKNFQESFDKILEGLSGAILVEKPCKIINVHSQNCVDIEYYDSNKADVIYKVPVKHIQTNKGYIFLGLNVGDRGTVCFLDNDISQYYNGNYGNIRRKHNINDGLYSCGFYPLKEQYVFPQGDVVIGTTSGATINLSSNAISITGGEITISGSKINLASDTTIDGKNFLEHTHSNGNDGNPTGCVI